MFDPQSLSAETWYLPIVVLLGLAIAASGRSFALARRSRIAGKPLSAAGWVGLLFESVTMSAGVFVAWGVLSMGFFALVVMFTSGRNGKNNSQAELWLRVAIGAALGAFPLYAARQRWWRSRGIDRRLSDSPPRSRLADLPRFRPTLQRLMAAVACAGVAFAVSRESLVLGLMVGATLLLAAYRAFTIADRCRAGGKPLTTVDALGVFLGSIPVGAIITTFSALIGFAACVACSVLVGLGAMPDSFLLTALLAVAVSLAAAGQIAPSWWPSEWADLHLGIGKPPRKVFPASEDDLPPDGHSHP